MWSSRIKQVGLVIRTFNIFQVMRRLREGSGSEGQATAKSLHVQTTKISVANFMLKCIQRDQTVKTFLFTSPSKYTSEYRKYSIFILIPFYWGRSAYNSSYNSQDLALRYSGELNSSLSQLFPLPRSGRYILCVRGKQSEAQALTRVFDEGSHENGVNKNHSQGFHLQVEQQSLPRMTNTTA